MQNEYGGPGREKADGVATRAIHQGYPPGPPSLLSGTEWVSVNPPDLDGGVGLEANDGWRTSPPPEAPSTLANPFLKRESSQDLPQRYEQQMQQLQHLRDSTPPLFRRLRRLATLRENVVALRIRANVESEHCEEYRLLVSQFQEAFMQEAQKLLAQIPGDLSTHKLRAYYNQAVEVRERHDSCAQYTRTLETRLGSIESKMQNLEAKVKDAATRMNDMLRHMSFPADSGTTTVVESDLHSLPSEATSADVPPLIQDYFDKAGDVKIERDKLFDLDQEHREEKTRRQFERDQDITPAVSDEEFEERWLGVFADAELTFADATQQAEEALLACKKARLDPDAYRKVPSRAPVDLAGTPPPEEEPVAAATPSTQAQESSQAPQTPTRQIRFDPLDQLSFEKEDIPTQIAPRPRRRKSTGSPLVNRVADWVDSVSNRQEQRSRSISEASPLVFIEYSDVPDTWTTERRTSQMRRQRGSQASYLAQWVEYQEGEERPHFIKRSSSESELFIFHTQPNARRRVMDDWQSGQVRRYGTTAQPPSLRLFDYASPAAVQ